MLSGVIQMSSNGWFYHIRVFQETIYEAKSAREYPRRNTLSERLI